MLGCMTSGISGLSANNANMSIIANNIANVNTPGYKAQRATFADILNQQSGNLEIGSGVDISDISSVQSQGSVDSTTSVTDLSIDGSGFFIVKDDTGTFYTRAGQFHFNQDGKLVNPQGFAVQGWDIRNNESLTSSPTDIDILNISLPPKETESLRMVVNLDANAEIPGAFDINDTAGTSNYSSSISVYDSLGNKHYVTVYFRKSVETPAAPPIGASNEWEWHAVLEENGTQIEQANGTLTFNDEGALVSSSAITYLTGSGFNFNNGSVADQEIDIDFGTTIDEGGTGLTGSTQFASGFSTTSFSQDGYEPGSLLSISITKEGKVRGLCTNGQTQDIAIIALADFFNPDGLKKMGKNLYAANHESGQPTINSPGAGGKGKINAYTLEGSNVDLATEFMKMIVTQRAFQANARSITTADQLLTEVMSLKR